MEDDDVRLTRENATRGVRVMLPAFVIVFGWIGASYLLANVNRLGRSPALDYADSVMDIRGWGLMFAGVSALIAAAMVSGKRKVAEFAILVALVCAGIWTVVFVCAALFAQASPAAGAWPFLAGAACLATYRMLRHGEAVL